MENFTAYNPTTLHFGKGILSELPGILKGYGSRVLLLYGKGSIHQTGLYNRLKELLHAELFEVAEYGGIKSNPVITDVDAAAAVGRAHHADVILAVGGGSVIDSAKIVSVTIPVAHGGWDFFTGKSKPVTAIPLVSVLTLAATGTEMNPFAVVSNIDQRQKAAFGSPLTFPKHSFLDPALTLTVPRNYTAYGIADLIAHCFEAWFGIGEATLTDRFVVAIVREAMQYGPELLENLNDYPLREKTMFAATMALNGMTMYGRSSGDWGVHSAGHVLSFLYDIPHGASLTMVYPAWLRHFKEPLSGRITELGTALFDAPLTPDETIDRIEAFFSSLDCPISFADAGLDSSHAQEVIDGMVRNRVSGAHMKMTAQDYPELVKGMLK